MWCCMCYGFVGFLFLFVCVWEGVFLKYLRNDVWKFLFLLVFYVYKSLMIGEIMKRGG